MNSHSPAWKGRPPTRGKSHEPLFWDRLWLNSSSSLATGTCVCQRRGMLLDIPPGPFEAYLFDCDGTLIDSMPLHYEGWGHALDVLEIDFEFPRPLYDSLAGVSTENITAILNEKFALELDYTVVSDLKRQFFLDQIHRVQLIKPVIEFARRVARTHPIGITTGGIRHMVERSLEATGIRDLFPVIVNYEDVENGKPAPDMFLHCAELLGVDPEGCLVFEDGELGIQGAQAAGMQTVFVPST